MWCGICLFYGVCFSGQYFVCPYTVCTVSEIFFIFISYKLSTFEAELLLHSSLVSFHVYIKAMNFNDVNYILITMVKNMTKFMTRLLTSSFSSTGLLWGWRRKGIHLQGAKVHPAVWDFPEAPQALLRQVWSGERQDHSGLWQGGVTFFYVYMTMTVNGGPWQMCSGLGRTCCCRFVVQSSGTAFRKVMVTKQLHTTAYKSSTLNECECSVSTRCVN